MERLRRALFVAMHAPAMVNQKQAEGDEHDADDLRERHPAKKNFGSGAPKLGDESTHTDGDEVHSEERAGHEVAAAHAPQRGEESQKYDDIVDRSGMHALGGWHDAFRERHGPRHVGRWAVVTIGGEQAAHAAEGLPEQNENADDVRSFPKRHFIMFDGPRDREHAAEEAAVPHEARAAEHHGERRVRELIPMLDDEIEPRADEPADDGCNGNRARQIRIHVSRFKFAPHENGGHEKAEHGHEAETVQRERADYGEWDVFEDVRVH